MRRSSVALASVSAAALSTFGPYTPLPGIRTEQLVIYVLAVGAVLSGTLRLSKEAVLVVAGFFGILLIAAVGSIVPTTAVVSAPRASAYFSNFDNYVLPVAVIALCLACARSAVARERLLERTATIAAYGGAINGVVAVVSTRIDLVPVLSRFWTGTAAAGGDSVASRATEAGRYSGIYNQPAEAGLFYGVALLAALYVFRDQPRRLGVVALLIGTGGALSVSKVFILVGLPIALVQYLRTNRQRGSGSRLPAVLTAGMVVILAGQLGALDQWDGSDRLLNLLSTRGNFVQRFTAGRFGEEGTINRALPEVLDASPWFGFGASGLRLPYDTLFLEVLVLAGLAGLVFLGLISLGLVTAWRARRPCAPPGESALAGGLLLLAAGGAFGIPSLTANRASALLWMMLALSILAPGQERQLPRTRAGSEEQQTAVVRVSSPRPAGELGEARAPAGRSTSG